MPTIIPTLKRILEEDGVELPDNGTHTCPTFESNVPFVLRYMIDSEINGSNWLELPAGAYTRRVPGTSSTTTTTQLEVDVVYSDIISHKVGYKLAPSIKLQSTNELYRIAVGTHYESLAPYSPRLYK
jgi:hypothetical protein